MYMTIISETKMDITSSTNQLQKIYNTLHWTNILEYTT